MLTGGAAPPGQCLPAGPDGARLCRLRDLAPDLAVGVAVLAVCPETPADAVAAYRAAPGAAPGGACLATLGPLLDGPDEVAAGHLRRDGAVLRLTIEHTSVRRLGRDLLRNLPWRPLLMLALPPLPRGDYRLAVTWRAVAALGDDAALAGGTQTVVAGFVAGHA